MGESLTPAERKEELLAQYRAHVRQGGRLIFAGHSLGGGIAQAFAAELPFHQVGCVVFNSPGLLFSQHPFRVDPATLLSRCIHVNSENDAVSMIDPARAMVQTVHCQGSYLGCHGIPAMICELWRSCRGPGWPLFCALHQSDLSSLYASAAEAHGVDPWNGRQGFGLLQLFTLLYLLFLLGARWYLTPMAAAPPD